MPPDEVAGAVAPKRTERQGRSKENEERKEKPLQALHQLTRKGRNLELM